MNIFLIREVVRLIRKVLISFGILLPSSTSPTAIMPGIVLTSRMRNFIRCAGISGALAICLGVYGAHVMKPDTSDELRRLFQLAQTYHLLHSAALLGVPFASRPMITGALFLGGISLFCGPLYYHAIRDDAQFRRVTPYGGMLLLAGWISIAVL